MNVGNTGVNKNPLIAAFNMRSAASGWSLHCSHCEHFNHASLHDLHQVWLRIAARGAPSKRDFSVRMLAPHLRDVTFIDRVAGTPHRYRLRFFGSRMAAIAGDHTGKFLEEVLPAKRVLAWSALYNLVIETATPMRVQSDDLLNGLEHLRAEVYVAPLVPDDKSHTASLAPACSVRVDRGGCAGHTGAMTPRLKAGIFVRALIRRAETGGAMAAVLRKGAEESGAVFLQIRRGDGTYMVLDQARQGDGDLVWVKPLGDAADDAKVRAYFEKQVRFDPDIWILEIDDRDGRAFVDEPIV